MQTLSHFIIPRRCHWCHCIVAADALLCSACQPFLPRLGVGCYQCALPLPCSVPACADCLRKPPSFTRAVIPFAYQYPVTDWIQQLKYSGRLTSVNMLGYALLDEIQLSYQTEGAYPTHIIPVPLHTQRLRARGFNQTNEIGKILARHLPCELLAQVCRRVIATSAQSQLTKFSRMRNVVHAFTVVRQPLPAHIALLDDVMTTGQTLRALAQACRSAGARRIDVWCVARTLKNR